MAMEPEVGEARAPLLEGWHTLDPRSPHLIGSRCTSCGSYYFPKLAGFCRNPDCDGEAFESVELSRTGTLWSYTNAGYQPPAPFVAREPFTPFAIAAVELDKEKMIILGPVIDGVGVEQLRVGLPMELVLETVADSDPAGRLSWKWRPAEGAGA
jgi:uncharacterized protein